MRDYTLTHLSDALLLRELSVLVTNDRATTARMLAHLAEVDVRRLYAPAGYSSLFAYCVEELRMSEDAASKRIQAARAARRFPILFTAVAEGRLHLSAVCLLAPHLTPENVDEWIESASHRRKAEIEMHRARRFPSPAGPPMVRPLTAMSFQHAPGHVDSSPIPQLPEQFLVQVTIPEDTHEKIRYARSLLSHAVPTGDLVQLIDRAFDALIAQPEKRKVGAGTRHRATRDGGSLRRERRPETRGRYIPAHVRRAVWERDRGQCNVRRSPWPSVRLTQLSRVRPCGSGGAGRDCLGARAAATLSSPQSLRGRTDVRGRIHEPEESGGAGRGG